MARKIAVILFVICLDIAFILMIRGDYHPMLWSDVAKLETSYSIGPMHHTSAEPLVLEEAVPPSISDETTVLESAKAVTARERRHLSVRDGARFLRKEPKRKLKRPAPGIYTAAEPFRGFTDTVILYRNASYEKRPVTSRQAASVIECEPNFAPPRRKKPIFKKAVPILKKPYDWVKDLVSD